MKNFVLLFADSARFQILLWVFKFFEALFLNWVGFIFNTARLVFQLGSQSLPEFVIIFEAEWSSYDGPDTGTHIRQYVNVGLKNKKNLSTCCMTNLVIAINCSSKEIIDRVSLTENLFHNRQRILKGLSGLDYAHVRRYGNVGLKNVYESFIRKSCSCENSSIAIRSLQVIW